jgi:hypothetical protein
MSDDATGLIVDRTGLEKEGNRDYHEDNKKNSKERTFIEDFELFWI